jgi:hypothetical protein
LGSFTQYRTLYTEAVGCHARGWRLLMEFLQIDRS